VDIHWQQNGKFYGMLRLSENIAKSFRGGRGGGTFLTHTVHQKKKLKLESNFELYGEVGDLDYSTPSRCQS